MRIEIILRVASMEKTIEWYERVLDWNGDYDVFNKDACTELMSKQFCFLRLLGMKPLNVVTL